MSTTDIFLDNTTPDPASDTRRYPFQAIERAWQERWAANQVYRTDDPKPGAEALPKFYVLDMFPYPSGSGLHVGHCKNYVPGDAFARFMRMRGHNILHPMGWDAFGQPAEQDAIRRGVNPSTVVPELAREYKRQMNLLGIGYDWSREINSTDPGYYKWNQWAFLRLWERGIAYQKLAPVNWCVNEATVLANEEVSDNKCWRCDGPVVKKDLLQWFFRITAYADKLLAGLETIDWPDGIKTQQRDWIGRSEGVEFDLLVAGAETEKIRVFTTRVDTIYGMSFVVLAPEHPLVARITTSDKRAEVEAYVARAARLTDQDRTDDTRERTGVFIGASAINPVSGAPVPVYVADYVLGGYGTGAIMAVPAHDSRDFDFARRYDLPTPVVIIRAGDETAPDGATLTQAFIEKDNGVLVNSGVYNGLTCKGAAAQITAWMEAQGVGVGKTNYKLRDWLVSRQRYWGTPIPVIHCPDCGAVPVPYDQLPVVLPDVENYKASDGRSPLASIPEFVNTTCPQCGKAARRETDTMAGSVDSSWYFLRFTSPHDTKEPWERTAADYWMPVDQYIGGREHAVGHLLYARFFTQFFHDEGLINVSEPFQTLRNQGMLLAQTLVDTDSADAHPIKPEQVEGFDRQAWLSRWAQEGPFVAQRIIHDAETGAARTEPVTVEWAWLKMSKSKGNAVTPDEIAERYGADALRLYVLFVAPFEDTIQWSEEAMSGPFRFLNRVWDAVNDIAPAYRPDWPDRVGDATDDDRTLRRRTHQAIAKVTEDLAAFRFNTAVSALMVHSDALRKHVGKHGGDGAAVHEAAATLTKLLAPLAPHIADELWSRLGHAGGYLYHEAWPAADPAAAAEDEVTLVVQINGKVRDRLLLPATSDAAACETAALASAKIQTDLAGKTVRKVVVIAGKLVNIVAS